MSEQVTVPDKLDELLEKIACKHLSIQTLQVRRSDQLDFHDVSVWGLKEALRAAFVAGMVVGANCTVPR